MTNIIHGYRVSRHILDDKLSEELFGIAKHLRTNARSRSVRMAADLIYDDIGYYGDRDIFVARDSWGKVLGILIGNIYEDDVYGKTYQISTLGSLVDTPGIGSALVQACIDYAKSIKADRVGVYASKTSTQFYRKVGFGCAPAWFSSDPGDLTIEFGGKS